MDLATLVGLGEAAEKVEWVAQVGPGRIAAVVMQLKVKADRSAVETLAELGELA